MIRGTGGATCAARTHGNVGTFAYGAALGAILALFYAAWVLSLPTVAAEPQIAAPHVAGAFQPGVTLDTSQAIQR